MSEKFESIEYVRNPSKGCLMRKDRRAYKRWRREHPDAPQLQVYHLVPVSRETQQLSTPGTDRTRRAHSAPPRFGDWDEQKWIASLMDTSPLVYRHPPSPPPRTLDVRDVGYTSLNTVPLETPYPYAFPMYGSSQRSPIIEDSNSERRIQESPVASQEVRHHDLNLREAMTLPPSSQR